ncbi:MAG: endonuclease/exonuclease/phosphatase family protein [Pseudomonadota bacterium]
MTQRTCSTASLSRPGWLGKARWPLRVFAVFIIATSLSSLITSDEWWVRMWDFPRIQLAVLALIFSIVLFIFERGTALLLACALAVCGVWQTSRVSLYTPFVSPEMEFATPDPIDNAGEVNAAGLLAPTCFSMLAYNVQQSNRDYARSLAMLEREDPDIVVLFETDQAWLDALEPVLARYPERAARPLANKYGLAFATRLPVLKKSIQALAEHDTPSVFVTLKAERTFQIIGLHPRPPKPGQDTDERDAELVIAARYAQTQNMPVLALGDFNDVAWSDTSSLFKRLGGFLDPRIGRGVYATFPSNMTWLGWPLDHVFATPEFTLAELRVLENTGSDHRAILARLCLADDGYAEGNATPARVDNDDREDAIKIVDEFGDDTRTEQAQGR